VKNKKTPFDLLQSGGNKMSKGEYSKRMIGNI